MPIAKVEDYKNEYSSSGLLLTLTSGEKIIYLSARNGAKIQAGGRRLFCGDSTMDPPVACPYRRGVGRETSEHYCSKHNVNPSTNLPVEKLCLGLSNKEDLDLILLMLEL